MRKNLNKLATLALSAMMVGTMAMPAFADINVDDSTQTINFNKTLTGYSAGTYAPTFDFTFAVTGWGETEALPTTFAEYLYDGGNTALKNVLKGKDGDVEVSSINFSANNEGKIVATVLDAGGETSKPVTLTFNASNYTQPGVYVYHLKETTKNNDKDYSGLTIDDTVYNLYVYVENDDYNAYTVKYAVIEKPAETADDGTTTSSKVDTIKNTYSTHDVTIDKQVTGNSGDTSENGDFKFVVSVTNSDGVTRYYDYSSKENNKSESASAEGKAWDGENEGDKIQLTLDHTGNIVITGLVEGDVVTVKELAVKDGYTVSTDIQDGLKGSNLTNASDENDNEITFTVEKTSTDLTDDDYKVTFTNNKASVIPTGIVMDIAPYVMMLGAAGGLGAMFVGKKREDEE